MPNKISVIIITKNEEQDIKKCLESVKWADEIIVLDSGSTDNTVRICKEYTEKVYQTDWPGFGIQKNRALEKATGNWVLSIDSDEWLPDNLISEIKHIISDNKNASYYIPRRSYYLGKLIKFGHWRGDKVLRLFKNKYAKFSSDKVHERIIAVHPSKITKNYILHNSFKNHEEVLNKVDQYSTYGAEIKFKKKKQASIFTAISHSLFAFIKSYFIKAGFLDGAEGFMLALSFAEGTFYRYVKLRHLNKNYYF